jgi:hypothetical protein
VLAWLFEDEGIISRHSGALKENRPTRAGARVM